VAAQQAGLVGRRIDRLDTTVTREFDMIRVDGPELAERHGDGVDDRK
jgi:hypothetical protein